MIADVLMNAKAARRKISACHTNRASQLGHECERYLVLLRTAWDKAEEISVDLQARFDVGNALERQTLQDMMAAGLTVVDLQRDFFDKLHQVSGHIDGKLQLEDGHQIPFEIKSMAPAIYDQIHTLADFQKYRWTRKYIVQMQLYLYMTEKSEGLFILVALDGRVKEVPIFLDYGFVDEILAKADRINAHVKAKTLPEPVADVSLCKQCNLFGACCPPMDWGPGAQIIDEADLISMLEDRDATYDAHLTYDKVHKRIREYIGERPHVLAGEFDIKTKKSSSGTVSISISRLAASPEAVSQS